ncbi:MAG TPA: squalene synthase HpnC [Ignavibacteriaceae bacterium]|nr:squalene synthase HpnC [Ignavibacteriaceae bacterium]
MANLINTTYLDINSAYNEAIKFAKNHYENFPVISFLIPKNLRKHIGIIYWFARTADDIADEGALSEAERLNQLNEFEKRLTETLKGNFSNQFDLALHSTVNEKNLSTEHFYNLLKAFRQDITVKRYEDFSSLQGYCVNSANPVGRLILELYNIHDEDAFNYSDSICTALQLTNFWQDTALDYQKGRIYYPLNDMEKYGVTENMFEFRKNNFNLREMVKSNVDQTLKMFDKGSNLLTFLHGRLKYEIKWTILGGEMILDKIRLSDYDVLNFRPHITKKDFLTLLIKSFLEL